MAAIRLSENKGWEVAGWVFRYLAENLIARAEKDSPIYTTFEYAVKSNLLTARIDELEPSEQRRLAGLVTEIYGELVAKKHTQFATEEGYEGLKSQIGKLVEMLEAT